MHGGILQCSVGLEECIVRHLASLTTHLSVQGFKFTIQRSPVGFVRSACAALPKLSEFVNARWATNDTTPATSRQRPRRAKDRLGFHVLPLVQSTIGRQAEKVEPQRRKIAGQLGRPPPNCQAAWKPAKELEDFRKPAGRERERRKEMFIRRRKLWGQFGQGLRHRRQQLDAESFRRLRGDGQESLSGP